MSDAMPPDSDRPPVLAHQRFLEDRESFTGLNLAQRFRRIHDTNLWGADGIRFRAGLGDGRHRRAARRIAAASRKARGRVAARCALRRRGLDQRGWLARAHHRRRHRAFADRAAARPRRGGRNHGRISSRRCHLRFVAAMRRDPVPRCSCASVVCEYRTRGCEFQGVWRCVADYDHVSGNGRPTGIARTATGAP